MNLVDLAGSEQKKRTGVTGEQLKEASNINKSLSQLGSALFIQIDLECSNDASDGKAMQNKAVVNEETANDVKLFHEQICQLKEELIKMKVNSSNPQEGGSAGFSNGWSARRNYNILRLSLGQPMMLPPVDAKDFDEKMEIDHEEEDVDPSGLSSPKDDDDDHLATINMELYSSPNHDDCHPATIETELHSPPNYEETEELDNVVIELAETTQDSEPVEVVPVQIKFSTVN
ncbi:unnamed protein product [Sphagnum balticum]